MVIINESTHEAGERIQKYWEYTGENRSVDCYELFEYCGQVCMAYGDIEKPHEILRQRRAVAP